MYCTTPQMISVPESVTTYMYINRGPSATQFQIDKQAWKTENQYDLSFLRIK